jgi:hypothetical protein
VDSTGAGDRVRLTARDYRLLAFAAEHQLVLESQLERLVGARQGTLKRRLSTLVASSHLSSGSVFGDTHYQIGSEGLAAVGSSLKRPRLRLPNYKHDVGVAWLWLAARGGTFGELRHVLAERSLRSHDGAVDRPLEPYGVRTGEIDRHGNERLHYPDLLLIDRDGRRLALELELTPKGRQRVERILGGYGADPRIDCVLYFVEATSGGRGIRRAMERTLREMGLSERIRLQFIREIRLTPANPGRKADRAAPDRPAVEVAR